jgi:putative phage-type endonuclease
MYEDRTTFIGSSDVAGIFGLSPWQTPLDVYRQKVGVIEGNGARGNGNADKYLIRGRRLEPYIFEMLADEYGIIAEKRNIRCRDTQCDFLSVELDGVTRDGDIVEVKSVSPFRANEWGEPGTEAIPIHYELQVQDQMMVTKRDKCIVAALFGADELRIYQVKRDYEVTRKIREKTVDFWQNHVLPRVPPPAINLEDAQKLYPIHTEQSIECTDALLHAYMTLKNAHAELHELQSKIERAEFEIKSALGPASALQYHGETLATWRTQTARRVDVTALQAQCPDIAEKFRVQKMSRVFRLK